MNPSRLRAILSRRDGKAADEAATVALVDAASGLASAAALELAAAELATRSIHVRAPIAVARFRVVGAALEDEEFATLASHAQVPLRHYDRLYRVGAAELVLLLPGSDAAAAVPVASRVRSEVEPISLAAGISSSVPGEPFVFEWIAAKAEEALERAEERGGLSVVPSLHAERIDGDGPIVVDAEVH